jgi:hypothetical protein
MMNKDRFGCPVLLGPNPVVAYHKNPQEQFGREAENLNFPSETK